MTSLTRRAVARPAGVIALTAAALASQAFTTAPAYSAAVLQPASGTRGWRIVKTISLHDQSVVLVDLDAVSARDAWVAGVTLPEYADIERPLLEHRDGSVKVFSPTDVWVFGDKVLGAASKLKFAPFGTTWTPKGPRSAATGSYRFFSDLVPAPGGLWALGVNFDGDSRVWRYSNGWSAPVRLPWALLQLASVPYTDSIWAIGESADADAGLIVVHGRVPR